ncbi:unnamed protein product [Closterium sp. NIES-65]|nr:unnamed protein product [Closterium sp. NIES-65]
MRNRPGYPPVQRPGGSDLHVSAATPMSIHAHSPPPHVRAKPAWCDHFKPALLSLKTIAPHFPLSLSTSPRAVAGAGSRLLDGLSNSAQATIPADIANITSLTYL